ncbi:hydrogenase maturation protein [Accumulibacter sp.]|uniref:hydrogenase maturation protein n=1 Tax=Accumulibacter sp. TaxID=2053492 RepID=UPI0025E7DCD1|nr:hydrogenase maturation protein [Accumulibacter sp.]MCM8613990.1 hydrogenase maturation protein [Accumulibacter sp.]MCM8637747.1 hydrogenase maturation protein [Accumulibacter sp.]MCM8638842.1 hydrogenase maturation protein [Accumulibacter sp.]
MRILLLCHAFNSLSQCLYCELAGRGHVLSVEYDIADSVAEEAVALFRPDLIIAPYLRRAIPETIWRAHCCLVVHPGIVGDRGPSALDRAIQDGERAWGVTVLQATGEMDAGPVWASAVFPMRLARKSSLYRHEVSEAATRAVLCAVERFSRGDFVPLPPSQTVTAAGGELRPLLRQAERAIDWQRDDSRRVLARLHAADGFPGVADELFGEPCLLFDAWPEDILRGGPAGAVIAWRETAILRATVDGAVWIGHVRRCTPPDSLKLPAAEVFATQLAGIREAPLSASPAACWAAPHRTWQDIRYEEADDVGFLHFEFYNGAMSSRQCRRLLAAYDWVRQRPLQVIVLMGGRDLWSNGIHLQQIEAAESPADESWANIDAIDDLAEAIIRTDDRLTIAALQGNCAAGGCFLARAADIVWARAGVVLNPHYRNMGNLYGSEYWTYLLPARVGEMAAAAIMQQRLPLSASAGVSAGLLDACLANDPESFRIDVARRARELAQAPGLASRLREKRARRAADELQRPLADYRAAEMAELERNFYGFDPSYHIARHHFVHKTPHSWTPRHLAIHRELGWQPAP